MTITTTNIANEGLSGETGAASATPSSRRTASGSSRSTTCSTNRGPSRVRELLQALTDRAHRPASDMPFTANTPYVNTIPAGGEPPYPGDREIERRIKSIVRWNAHGDGGAGQPQHRGIGGHISTYACAATLYEVGFNHFFRGRDDGQRRRPDLTSRGTRAPGSTRAPSWRAGSPRAAAQLPPRTGGRAAGLSSYPHPWLMPDFWQFPTVSMGLGPIMVDLPGALQPLPGGPRPRRDRPEPTSGRFSATASATSRRRWAPSRLAAREKLDNLIFVINCNLQRLDGPVRGNGKIIQELEAAFRGAGWNVIKVIWGDDWDRLLARDTDGLARAPHGGGVDGEYQKYSVEPGAYIREHFFGSTRNC